jgi:plastocyanin
MQPERILRRLSSSILPLVALLGASAASSANTVDVQQFSQSFSPQDIAINEGDTVVWHWNDGFHTVTEGTDGMINGNEAFHSALTNNTPTFSVTFSAAFLAANPRPNNRYDYFCEPHFLAGQIGSVTVCSPPPSVYCTSKPSSIPGCTPTISFLGAPSLAQGPGMFVVHAGAAPGNKVGLFFYSKTGALGTPVQNTFGWLCVNSPVVRIAAQNGGGSNGVCNGQYQVDFVTYAKTPPQNQTLVPGVGVDLQAWYRDPPNPGGANLTNAGHFVLFP